jgi:hypothetical protein
MNLIKEFEFKSAESVQPGELLKIKFAEHNVLAIMVKRNDGRAVFAVLEAKRWQNGPIPFHVAMEEPEGYCLSFGTEWKLQLIMSDETVPRRREYVEKPGVIHISEKRCQLGLAGTRPGDEFLFCDLLSMSFGALNNSAAPILEWKIWASDADAVRPSAQPIFAFKAN